MMSRGGCPLLLRAVPSLARRGRVRKGQLRRAPTARNLPHTACRTPHAARRTPHDSFVRLQTATSIFTCLGKAGDGCTASL
jgi:hypothetical protein